MYIINIDGLLCLIQCGRVTCKVVGRIWHDDNSCLSNCVEKLQIPMVRVRPLVTSASYSIYDRESIMMIVVMVVMATHGSGKAMKYHSLPSCHKILLHKNHLSIHVCPLWRIFLLYWNELHTNGEMDQIFVKVIQLKISERLIECQGNVLWMMECVPKFSSDE